MHKGLKSGSGHHRLDKCGPPMAVTRYRKTALTSSPCCVFSPVLLMMHLIPSMRPIPSLVSSSGLLDGMTFFFIFSFLAFSFRLVVFCPVSSFLSFFVLSLSRLFISFFYLYLPFSYLLFFLTDLRVLCQSVVMDTTCNMHVVVFFGWQAVWLFLPGASI